MTEEIIQHLATLPGAHVDVRLEIEIRVHGGIENRVVRIVTENAASLKLASSNFDRD